MKKHLSPIVSIFAIAVALPVSAADLIVDMPVAAAPDALDWTGFYAGAHAGYGSGFLTSPQAAPGTELDAEGWLAGVQGGYNQQFGNFVLGVEGDVSATNINWTMGVETGEVSLNVDWLASLRGRAGVAFDGVLVYATAGIEAMGGRYDFSGGGISLATAEATHFGPVVGVGAEVMVTDAVSLRAEYLYHSLDAENYTTTGTYQYSGDIAYEFHTVTAGVNFHF